MSAQIKINSIDLVGTWKYTASNKECLCNRSLQFPTTSQIEKKNIFRNNVVFGECNHAFHEECINKHIKTNNNLCPIDNLIWLHKKTTNNIKYSVMN